MHVYTPAEDSFLILEHMSIPQGSRVLDMGTGSGILAVEAAKSAREVVAADINPDAIEDLQRKAIQNIIPIHSDLFKNVDGTFDVILFNAPYLPGKEDSIWSGGEQGREVISNFLKAAGSHMEVRGRIFLLISSQTGIDETLALFTKHGFDPVITAKKHLFFETLALIQATKI